MPINAGLAPTPTLELAPVRPASTNSNVGVGVVAAGTICTPSRRSQLQRWSWASQSCHPSIKSNPNVGVANPAPALVGHWVANRNVGVGLCGAVDVLCGAVDVLPTTTLRLGLVARQLCQVQPRLASPRLASPRLASVQSVCANYNVGVGVGWRQVVPTPTLRLEFWRGRCANRNVGVGLRPGLGALGRPNCNVAVGVGRAVGGPTPTLRLAACRGGASCGSVASSMRASGG
jgi:hypothetical protein